MNTERLWQSSADAMLALDGDGAIVAVNPAAERSFGWTSAESAGRALVDMVHADDQPSVRVALHDLASGAALPLLEFRLRHRNGSYRWLSWNLVADGASALAVGRDIAAYKAQAEALCVVEGQLRQSQKMEALGQLTGGIAHDFNNLLTIISTSIQLLQRPNLADDRRQRFMGSISHAVSRAAKLTGQLLAFARRQALQPEVIDAAHNVAEIAEMVRTLIGSRVRLSLVADAADAVEAAAPASASSACWVDVDPGQFDTAIVNLAANARDAMAGVGTLTIGTCRVARIPPLRGMPARSGDFVAVSVQDTGTGIAPERLDRVFEPFYTTKPVGQGTGLGLAQVFGFAQQSGGAVQVESVLGEGTTFTLYLPLSRRKAATAAIDADASLAATPPRGRLLVVEDNLEVGAAAAETLAEVGYQVVRAPGGAEALALLADSPGSFIGVFSDVMMAPMDGIALARAIRSRYPWMPVLLCSGYSSVLASADAPEFPLLAKPYSLVALSQALHDAIGSASAEAARVIGLESLAVLDTGPEAVYDDATRRAAELFGAPMALVSLVDTDRQWFKSKRGMPAAETTREIAFCAHAIEEPDRVMVVRDAALDPRFAHNPLVTGDPNIRFYAGAPLVTSAGHAIGTICVLDTRPRDVDTQRLDELARLARQVVERLEQDGQGDAASPQRPAGESAA